MGAGRPAQQPRPPPNGQRADVCGSRKRGGAAGRGDVGAGGNRAACLTQEKVREGESRGRPQGAGCRRPPLAEASRAGRAAARDGRLAPRQRRPAELPFARHPPSGGALALGVGLAWHPSHRHLVGDSGVERHHHPVVGEGGMDTARRRDGCTKGLSPPPPQQTVLVAVGVGWLGRASRLRRGPTLVNSPIQRVPDRVARPTSIGGGRGEVSTRRRHPGRPQPSTPHRLQLMDGGRRMVDRWGQ